MRVDLPFGTFEGGFLCDEIRKEDNGKLFVIGLYTGKILLDSLPVELGFCAGMRVYPKQSTAEFKMRALLEGERVLEFEAVLASRDLGSTILTTPRFGVLVTKYGNLSIELSGDGTDWQELFRIPFAPTSKNNP